MSVRIEQIISMIDGNPGALAFIKEATEMDSLLAIRGLCRMQDVGITGSRLYMLWNDCCGRDTGVAIFVMNEVEIGSIWFHIGDGSRRGIPFDEGMKKHLLDKKKKWDSPAGNPMRSTKAPEMPTGEIPG